MTTDGPAFFGSEDAVRSDDGAETDARLKSLLVAADLRDRAAEVRDRAAAVHDALAAGRQNNGEPSTAADRVDRAHSAIDRVWSGRDRDAAAGDRHEVLEQLRGGQSGQ